HQVDVIAAELADALGADLLENTVVDAQDGDVERPTAEVVDEDGLIVLGIEAVGDGGGRRLVDEGEHLNAGGAGAELGGVAGEALRVGRDGDNALGEALAELLFGVLFEEAEEHDGDLLGAQILADERDAFRRAEDALDGADGALLVEVLAGLLAEGESTVA